MIQAAKAYYDLEQTMGDIASQLGLTRWQVGRLLRDARDQGVVQIEIRPRTRRIPELESRLQRAWNLREAVVVPARAAMPPRASDPSDGDRPVTDGDAVVADHVAQAAGQFLSALQPRPPLVGVSWGRTMAAVAHFLPRRWNPGVEVVLLNGAMNIHPTPRRTNNVAELFAQAGDGRATLLPVPAIVGRAETRVVLEADPVIAAGLLLARRADVVCFGLGGITADSVLVQSGCLAADDMERLRARGGVGDVLGRFIDRDGRIADPALDARTIGLALDALPAKTVAVGVAAGSRKHAVVLAALRARLMNVLVTDEETALAVLATGS